MDNDRLYRELNDATATDRWLEGLDFNRKLVLIDDGGHNSNWSLAVSFFNGAETIREYVIKKSGLDLFRREYAMMFLYRHSMELFLKHSLSGATRGHNLENLLNKLVLQIENEHGINISTGWFANEIRELSKVDPTAQGFRYSHDIHGKSALATSFFVDLEHLGQRMQSLSMVFNYLALARGDFQANEIGT